MQGKNLNGETEEYMQNSMDIKQVLVYASPVWHTILTVPNSQQIQRRATQIIERELGYDAQCCKHHLEQSSFRRENLSRKFSTDIKLASQKLHHILPQPKSTRYSILIYQTYLSQKPIQAGLRRLSYLMVHFITNNYY